MFQSEVGGGGRVDQEEGLQRPGYLIRDFVLRSDLGVRVQISDYRGRSNLVLAFFGEAADSDVLQEIARRCREFAEQDGTVIAVFQCTEEKAHSLKECAKLPFLILADDDGKVHKLSGAIDANGSYVSALYVTDRFGQIFSAWGEKNWPSVDEILKTLEFINIQCPECEPPEWPR